MQIASDPMRKVSKERILCASSLNPPRFIEDASIRLNLVFMNEDKNMNWIKSKN